MNRFGNTVKKMLIDRNITQKELAEIVGTSTNNINNILNKSNVTLNSMENIAEALDCDLDIQLVPKSDKP